MIAINKNTMNRSKDFQHASSTSRKMISSPISIPIQRDKLHSSNVVQECDVRRFQLATLIMHQRIMFHRIRSNQNPIPLSVQHPENADSRDYLTQVDYDNNEHEYDSNFVIFNLDVDDFKE